MKVSGIIALTIAVSAISAVSGAQQPKNSGKVTSSHLAGKGTPANLSRHKDNSALVLRQNVHSGPAADLNRIEQQSLHSQASSSGQSRVRAASLPKPGADKGNKSVPINFSGHAPTHSLATTKSTGRATGSTPSKPH